MLSAADAAAFEEHFLVCDECLARVEATDGYVRSMKEALGWLRQSSYN